MYLSMMVIQKEIYQNVAAISLSYGNGQAGVLGIMMPEVLYVQHFKEPFQQPNDLGKYLDDIPANRPTM